MSFLAVLMVLQMDFNRIAHHDADHGPWHGFIKPPELIVVIVAKRTDPLVRFQVDHDGGGLGSCDGRGNIGCGRQLGFDGLRRHHACVDGKTRSHDQCADQSGMTHATRKTFGHDASFDFGLP